MEISRDSAVLPLTESSSTVMEETESSSLSSPWNSQQEEINETEQQRQREEEPPLAGQSPGNVLSPSSVSNKKLGNRLNSFHSLYNYFGDASFDDSNEDWDYNDDKSGDKDDDDINHNAAFTSPMTECRNMESSYMNNNDESSIIIDGLPAQLHPAVSRGMNRVASCYFSVRSASPSNSASDLQSLLGLQEQQESKTAPSSSTASIAKRNNESHHDGSIAQNDLPSKNQQQQSPSSVRFNASDILYHDIMMNVFTYLDAQALASFSQTAHRPNFEVFYFLQLQLQRALLVTHSTTAETPNNYNCNDDYNDPLGGTIAGSGCIARLAAMEKEAAQEIVQEYLDSNTTLKTMPLSHSLAYIRHLLQKHRFGHYGHKNGVDDDNDNRQEQNHSATAAATTASSAALVVALVGVSASVMQAGTTGETIITTSLPNAILGMGLAGSMLKAGVTAGNAAVAARRNNTDDDGASLEGSSKYTANNNIKVAAEQLVRMMQALPFSLNRLQNQNDSINDDGSQQNQQNNNELNDNIDDEKEVNSSLNLATGTYRNPRDKRSRTGRSSQDIFEPIAIINDELEQNIDRVGETEVQAFAMQHPMTPNPYEHLPQLSEKSQNQHPKHSQTPPTNASNRQSKTQKRKMPSGCVGAYLKAVQKATYKVTELIKQRRREKFDSLQDDEKLHISATFLDACNSDATLPIVKEMLQVQSIIDADGFYIGSDTMETCALHTAAFHGASKVVEFLIKGIGEHSPNNDGGLCNVDLCDLNGWSALHFAAGANSVETVRVLASHGAKLALEASNGYTPFHWAQRLSNKQVAEELQRLGADVRFMEGRWQPLSLIANRFFSIIPSQS